VTLHLLSEQFDRGDIIAQAALSDTDENADRAYLEYRSATQGVELFIEAVKSHDRGWKPIRQTA
jgi:methionyl-tRNA formyltransferase